LNLVQQHYTLSGTHEEADGYCNGLYGEIEPGAVTAGFVGRLMGDTSYSIAIEFDDGQRGLLTGTLRNPSLVDGPFSLRFTRDALTATVTGVWLGMRTSTP